LVDGVSDIQECKSNDQNGLKFNQACKIVPYKITLMILLYAFGLLTTYKYYQTGLNVVCHFFSKSIDIFVIVCLDKCRSSHDSWSIIRICHDHSIRCFINSG
jgi:hypothetical protein